ncbi:conserved hypothetical protein [Xanthomonas citri pv. bilvae]|nr:conserved hypothetical protein [Xanthomonas citri pv. bilvae]
MPVGHDRHLSRAALHVRRVADVTVPGQPRTREVARLDALRCTLHRFSKDARSKVRKAPHRALPIAALFARTAPYCGSKRRAGMADYPYAVAFPRY